MFSKYSYNAQSTVANVVSDITAIMTGSITTVAGLSANCNQLNSTYTKTTLPGWTSSATGLYDATTQLTAPGATFQRDLIFVGGSINKWFACGAGGITSSPDRLTWTTVYSTAAITSLAYNGTTVVGVNANSASTNPVRSTDGVTWAPSSTAITMLTNAVNGSIAVVGTTFVTTSTTAIAHTSTDGNVWATIYHNTPAIGMTDADAQTVQAVITKSAIVTFNSTNTQTITNVQAQGQGIVFAPSPDWATLVGAIGYSGGADYINMSNNTFTAVTQYYAPGILRACAYAPATLTGVVVGQDVAYSLTNHPAVAPVVRTIPAGDYQSVCATTTSNLFVAVGPNVCARTTNSGATFTSVTIPTGNYKSIRPVNTSTTAMIAVGTDVVAQSLDYGATWTAKTIPTGDYLACAGILSTGTCIAVGVGGVLARSTDSGATWAAQTALPETITHVMYSSTNTSFLAVGVSGIVYISTTGASGTWSTQQIKTSNVTAVVQVSGPNVVLTGSKLGAAANCLAYSTDSMATWNVVPTPVAVSDFAISSTNIMITDSASGVYTSLLTSPGVWTLVKTAVVTAATPIIVASGTDFLIRRSNAATDLFVTTDNGATWASAAVDGAIISTVAYTNSGVHCMTANTKLYTVTKDQSSVLFTAPNTDNASNKYVIIRCNAFTNGTTGFIFLNTFESVTGVIKTRDITNSIATTAAQRFDQVNGGLLFCGASRYYMCLMSYLPSISAWGSSTGNGAGIVVEYERRDAWSTPSSGYPTHVWGNTSDLAVFYSPRVRSDNVNDVANATLVGSIGFTNNKQALDGSNIPIQAASDIYVSSSTTTTLVSGGALLGSVKQSTNSYGSTTDELVIAGNTYFIIAAGTQRLAIPKS